jgi:hypothetical protein
MILKKYSILFISLLLLITSTELAGQRRKPHNLIHYDYAPYHFGFTLGLNQMLFSIDHEPLYTHREYTGAEMSDVFGNWARLKQGRVESKLGFYHWDCFQPAPG